MPRMEYSSLPKESSFGGAIVRRVRVSSQQSRIVLAAVAEMRNGRIASGAAAMGFSSDLSGVAGHVASALGAGEGATRSVVFAVRQPITIDAVELLDESGRPFMPEGGTARVEGNMGQVVFSAQAPMRPRTYGRLQVRMPKQQGGRWFSVSGGTVGSLDGKVAGRVEGLPAGAVKLSLPGLEDRSMLDSVQVLSSNGTELPIRKRWMEHGGGWVMLGRTSWGLATHVRLPEMQQASLYTGLLNLNPTLRVRDGMALVMR